MSHRTVCRLRLTHPYHVDGRATEFAVEPDPRTEALRRNLRWLWRARPDGIDLVAPVDGEGRPSLRPPGNLTLTFGLRPLDADFALYTDLDELRSHDAPCFRRPASAPVPGSPTVLEVGGRAAKVTETLEFPARVTEALFVLGREPRPGSPSAAFVLEGPDPGSRAAWDPATRRLTVTATARPEPRPFRVSYPVRARSSPGLIAEVDIEHPVPSVIPVSGGTEFRIEFRARASRWNYLLVTNDPAGRDPFAIEATDGTRFVAAEIDPRDPLHRAVLEPYAGRAGVRLGSFVSEVPIACRERPAARYRLKQGAAVVLAALPTPAPRNLCTAGGQPAFFHVLERFTQP